MDKGSDQIVTKQSLNSHQATDYVTDYVADQVRRLLFVMVGEMSTAEMMKELGLKHTPSFRETYLMPSLNAGILQMTQPDKPKSPKQRYFLTDLGNRLLVNEQSRVASAHTGGKKIEEFISSLTEEERREAGACEPEYELRPGGVAVVFRRIKTDDTQMPVDDTQNDTQNDTQCGPEVARILAQ